MKNEVQYVVPTPKRRKPNALELDVSDMATPVRLVARKGRRQPGILRESWSWQPAGATGLSRAS